MIPVLILACFFTVYDGPMEVFDIEDGDAKKTNVTDPHEHARREHVKVYQGGCTSTLMGTWSWIDENGASHYEDPNSTCCTYRCANGHEWSHCY